MAWLKTGDNVADHPIVVAVLEHHQADDRSLNETFGFIMRCALRSASHFTDYVISYSTAISLAGGKAAADRLLELAAYAGYITPVETLDGKPAFKLIEDSDFIHIRSKEEIAFERQREKDRRDTSLTCPVWVRDGDACRYCRRIVSWSDMKSIRGGTFDHLVPGSPATHDTYVVCCRGCNDALGAMEYEDRLEALLPVPTDEDRHFSRAGVKYWGKTKWFTDHQIPLPTPTTEHKLRPGDFAPGATKISAFIKDVQERALKRLDDGTQPTAEQSPGSASRGTTGSQPDEAPTEPNTRGQSGTADRTSARPARDTLGDGQSGTGDSTSPRPASPRSDEGLSGTTTDPVAARPASPEQPPVSKPADQVEHGSTNDRAISPQSTEIEGRNFRDCRVGSGREGPGGVGPGRDGTGLVGSGARQRSDRLPPSARSKSQRRRRRRKE